MKFDKIQQEILKAAFKRDETHNEKCFQWLHFETDDNVCVVDHSVAIYIIPKKHWYLDTEKVFEKPPVQLEALMKEENDAEDVVCPYRDVYERCGLAIREFLQPVLFPPIPLFGGWCEKHLWQLDSCIPFHVSCLYFDQELD